MSRRLRSANVLLERINDIDAECTEDDQEILDMENDNTENYDPHLKPTRTPMRTKRIFRMYVDDEREGDF